MSNRQVLIELEIILPNGKKTITMEYKKGSEIEDCSEGKVVMLELIDGQSPNGIFKGMADDDVKLGSLDGKYCLGYKISWVRNYWEEIA